MFSEGAIPLGPKPPSPPPKDIPQYCGNRNNLGPELIIQYINYFIYVWTMHGNSFWICPVDSMGDFLFCYAWDGSDWKFIRLNIRQIDCFYQGEDRYAR